MATTSGSYTPPSVSTPPTIGQQPVVSEDPTISTERVGLNTFLLTTPDAWEKKEVAGVVYDSPLYKRV